MPVRIHFMKWERREFGGGRCVELDVEAKMRDTYAGTRERVRVKTCVEKRTEVGTTRRSGVRGECGLRGPYGVVKSIRPGLEPRLLALLTVVRRERHQRDWEDLEDVMEEGGDRGPRIKYHPRYVPFENVASLSILSILFFHSHFKVLSLGLTYSPPCTSPAHVRARVHGCHSNFQFRSLWRGNRVARC